MIETVTEPEVPANGAYAGKHAAPKVVQAMVGVMSRLKEVPKNGYNKEGKYSFATSDDILAMSQDAMVEFKMLLMPREISRKIVQKILMIHYEFDAYCEGEVIRGVVSHTGACRFEFKSGATDDKSVSKCLTSAQKYAIIAAFKVSTDDAKVERASVEDPDFQHHDGADDPDERRGDDRRDDRRGDHREPPNDDDRRREPPESWGGPPRDDRRPPDDDRRPPDDDRRRDPPEGRWDDGPRNGGRDNALPASRWDDPPPRDEPPFSTPGRPTDPPSDPAEVDFRAKVMAFKEGIKNAPNEDAAHDMWLANADLLRRCGDTTYDFLRDTYESVHRIFPPATT